MIRNVTSLDTHSKSLVTLVAITGTSEMALLHFQLTNLDSDQAEICILQQANINHINPFSIPSFLRIHRSNINFKINYSIHRSNINYIIQQKFGNKTKILICFPLDI